MMIWEQLQALVEGDSPEKKAAAGGAGGATRRCKHGISPPESCTMCNPGKKATKKSQYAALDIDMTGEEKRQHKENVLIDTSDERNNASLTFDEWQKGIEKGFLGHIHSTYDKKKAPIIIRAFRNKEKTAAEEHGMDVESLREDAYEHGATYDQYVHEIFYTTLSATVNAFQGRIYQDIVLRSAAGEEELLAKGGVPGAPTSQADVEMATPEFAEFVKWAQEMWKVYGQGVEFDQETWDETLHYFASTGQRFGSTPTVAGETGAGEKPEGPGIQVSRRDTSGMAPAPAQDDREYWEKMLKQRQASGKLGTLDESVWWLIIEAMKTFGAGDKPGEAIPPIQSPQQKAALPPMVKSQSDQPLYKKLMAMDVNVAATHFMNQYNKRLQSNKKLAGERQAMIDRGQQYPTPPPGLQGPELEKWKKLQQVRGQMAVTGQRQMDPEMFKKRRQYDEIPAEKRKFWTWWDPFGFKGNIPYTEM